VGLSRAEHTLTQWPQNITEVLFYTCYYIHIYEYAEMLTFKNEREIRLQ